MNEREIQKHAILRWIAENGEIDALTALRELGIMRLASRICDLKRDGVQIVDRWERKLDERGRVQKRWKVYTIPSRRTGMTDYITGAEVISWRCRK